MRAFIPHSDEEIRRMLKAVGVEKIDDLFDSVPEDCRLEGSLDLPRGLDEHGTVLAMEAIASRNRPAAEELSFLGGGIYDRITPALTRQMLSRPEFYTAYTPYQPEVAQGTLQVIYEFQTMIARLTGMDAANASLYDGPSALAEAILVAGAATRRNRVLLPASLQPSARRVVESYTAGQDYQIDTLPVNVAGELDTSAVEAALGEETAALVVQSPNYYGVLEDLSLLAPLAAAAGALLIVHTDPVSLALIEPPGSFGADIVTAEGQGLGLPMNYGGPGLGIMAVGKKYLRRLPGRLVGATTDSQGRTGYVLTLQTREQHIRREKATSNICTNQGLMMLAATVNMACFGEGGMKTLAENLAIGAATLAAGIETLEGFSLAFSGDFFQEFVVKTPVPTDGILAAGLGEGIHAGIPVIDDHHLLVCVSEKHRAPDLRRFLSFLKGVGS